MRWSGPPLLLVCGLAGVASQDLLQDEQDLLTLDFSPLLDEASSRSDDVSLADSKFISDLVIIGNQTILTGWQAALTGIYENIGSQDYVETGQAIGWKCSSPI